MTSIQGNLTGGIQTQTQRLSNESRVDVQRNIDQNANLPSNNPNVTSNSPATASFSAQASTSQVRGGQVREESNNRNLENIDTSASPTRTLDLFGLPQESEVIAQASGQTTLFSLNSPEDLGIPRAAINNANSAYNQAIKNSIS